MKHWPCFLVLFLFFTELNGTHQSYFGIQLSNKDLLFFIVATRTTTTEKKKKKKNQIRKNWGVISIWPIELKIYQKIHTILHVTDMQSSILVMLHICYPAYCEPSCLAFEKQWEHSPACKQGKAEYPKYFLWRSGIQQSSQRKVAWQGWVIPPLCFLCLCRSIEDLSVHLLNM